MKSFSRRTFLAGSVVTAAGALSACRRGQVGDVLYVMDWAHYIPVRILQLFEREYKIRVQYQAYGSNQEMLLRLRAAEFPWDVAFPCQQYIQPMTEQKLLRRLDHSKLPNLSNLEDAFSKPFWDPQMEYGVPVSWGLTGIAYSRQIQVPIRRWADMWDERLRERLTMLNDPDEVLAAALLKLGLPMNSSEPEHLRLAAEQAIEQKRLLHSYGILESKDRLISGEFQVAQLWSNLAGQAIAASPNINFVFPEEGFPIYAENAVILAGAQNPDGAHAFINFLMIPEVSAMLSEYAYSPSTVRNTKPFLPLPLREDPLLFPNPAEVARGQWFRPQPAEARERRVGWWQQVQTA